MPATAVFTPTTRPSPSASAPPELPGLSAASVWITFSTRRPAEPERVGSERPEGRDHAGGDGAGQTHRAADRDDQLSDPQLVRVPELGRGEVARLRPDHGQIREGIGSDDLGAELAAVGEGGRDPVPTGDHVRGGQHVAVGGDRDATARALRAAAPRAPRDGEMGDRGRQPLGDAGHRAGVGVEGVGVGQALGR